MFSGQLNRYLIVKYALILNVLLFVDVFCLARLAPTFTSRPSRAHLLAIGIALFSLCGSVWHVERLINSICTMCLCLQHVARCFFTSKLLAKTVKPSNVDKGSHERHLTPPARLKNACTSRTEIAIHIWESMVQLLV